MSMEAFMINPYRIKKKKHFYKNPGGELMLINPKRKGGVRKMKKRLTIKGKKHRLTITEDRISPLSRLARPELRGMKINPFYNVGGSSMFSRPMWRRSIKRRRSYRRNPVKLIPSKQSVMSTIQDTLSATAGFVGAKVLPNYVLPANMRTGTMGIVGKIGTAVVLSMVANKVLGKNYGKTILLGGLVAISTEFAGQLLLKVGGTLQDSMSLGAYIPELSAYVVNNQNA